MSNKTKLEKAYKEFKSAFKILEQAMENDPGLLWSKDDQRYLETIEESVEKIIRVIQATFSNDQVLNYMADIDKELLRTKEERIQTFRQESEQFLRAIKHPQADKLWIQRLHDLAEVWTKKCLIATKGLETKGFREFIKKVEEKNKEQLIESSVEEFKQQHIKGEPKEKLMVFSRIYGKKLLVSAVEEIKHKRLFFKGAVGKIPKFLREEIVATKDNTKAAHLLLAASFPGTRDFTDFVFEDVRRMWIKKASFQRLIPPYNMTVIEKMMDKYMKEYRSKAPKSEYAMAQVLGYLLIKAKLSISDGIKRARNIRDSLKGFFHPQGITEELRDKAINLLTKIEKELTKILHDPEYQLES